MATDNEQKSKATGKESERINRGKIARLIKLDQLLRFSKGMTIYEILGKLADEKIYSNNESADPRLIKADLAEIQKKYGGKMIPMEKSHIGRERLWRYEDLNFTIFPQISHDMEIIRKAIEKLDLFKGDPRYDMLRFFLLGLEKGINGNEAQFMSFDNNIDVHGLDFIETILNAIVTKSVLKMTYKSFSTDEFTSNIHPYHLRQYNRRWYVFAYSEEKQEIRNYALDRILEVRHLSKPYIPTDINFDEYFDDIIGVTNYKHHDIEKVVLKVDKKSYDYIRTKPLHWTQTERKDMETKNHVFIQLKVKMNTELEMLICSYGDAVEVIEPVSLREAIFKKVEKMYNQYKV